MNNSHSTAAGARQQQFLKVISRDEAVAVFEAALQLQPVGRETLPLQEVLGRIIAHDIASPVNVPGFDRANVDGFAVRAADTHGASEEVPRTLRLNTELLTPGKAPQHEVAAGTATQIATGAVVPRGADAIVMVEHTDIQETADGVCVEIDRPLAAGENVSYAGSDISLGEIVLRAGTELSSREVGVLAAVGWCEATVYKRPTVAILSTGNEIVAPGSQRPLGKVYDSNQAILSAAVAEAGGQPLPLGVVTDDADALEAAILAGLAADVLLLSGGTSKGAGDLSYQVVQKHVTNPGILAHGVALKPGKPICLAAQDGKPVVILPGFPTSAIFTFHEFVAPVIRMLGGRQRTPRETLQATLPFRVNSDRGRRDFQLVSLIDTDRGPAAYPLGKGSGSVTTFSHADGFITIDEQAELVPAGTEVTVTRLTAARKPADLVAVGSHCVGLDRLLSLLQRQGFTVKSLSVGSQGGLAAVRRDEADIAGMHLLDPETNVWNTPFLDDTLRLIRGYTRQQCFVFRPNDARFQDVPLETALQRALTDETCRMVNRNVGSGTRFLIDELLKDQRPPGYAQQPRSHDAVVAAVIQGRADWGVAIEPTARRSGAATIPLREEHYDFAVPVARWERPAVVAFRELLDSATVREALAESGFHREQV